ncbi:DUF1810 family protein [Mucilaginibacter jinjuensis]|uniref:DUF1810 family protein n=1 Tax=Mucilaginibacter jinjuensis TaxID=1176721 RepID=UPI003B589668
MTCRPRLKKLRQYSNKHEETRITALADIKSGKNRGHWMWYIFPYIAGLGLTDISKHNAIKDLQKATDRFDGSNAWPAVNGYL